MSGAIKRRVLSLERNGQIERAAMMKELQYDIFEAMRFNQEDDKLLDAIVERGEASTAEEQSFLQRFSAECFDRSHDRCERHEAAFKIVSSRKRGRNIEPYRFR